MDGGSGDARGRHPDHRAAEPGQDHPRHQDRHRRSHGQDRHPDGDEQQAHAHRRRRSQPACGKADEESPSEVRGEVQRAEQAGDGVGVHEVGVHGGQQERVPEAPEALGHAGGQHQERDEHPRAVGGTALSRHASTVAAHQRRPSPDDGDPAVTVW